MSHIQHTQPLWRRAVAEALGTGLLVTIVVGSGIAAANLSPNDVGLQLLENAFATALGLAVLIVILGPVSGAHFNPAVSIIDWWLGQRTRTRSGTGTGSSAGVGTRYLAAYIPAQVLGATAGAILANLMFGESAVSWSTTPRAEGHLLIGETVATAGLIMLIFALARSGRGQLAAPAVGAYIGSAYWFTSSTSFANPAVTIGRAFSDTFAGIAPGSIPGFIAAQAIGACIGAGLAAVLYPDTGEADLHSTTPHANTAIQPTNQTASTAATTGASS